MRIVRDRGRALLLSFLFGPLLLVGCGDQSGEQIEIPKDLKDKYSTGGAPEKKPAKGTEIKSIKDSVRSQGSDTK